MLQFLTLLLGLAAHAQTPDAADGEAPAAGAEPVQPDAAGGGAEEAGEPEEAGESDDAGEPVEPGAGEEAEAAEEAEAPSRRALRRDARDAKVMERARKIFDQRSLALHPFITPQFAESALPTSHLASSFGVAGVFAAITNPLTGEPTTSAYLAAGGTLDAGVRFGRWVGLEAAAGGLAGVSAGRDTEFDLSASAAWRVSGGVPVRLLQHRKSALTLKPVGFYSSATTVDVGAGYAELERQIQAGEDPDFADITTQMLRGAEAYGGALHVAFAHAVGSAFGMQLSAGGGASEFRSGLTREDRPDITASQGLVQGGIALSFDANPVPLAIMLEYGVDARLGLGPLSGIDTVTHEAGVGVYLNGLTNTVGIEASVGVGPTQINAGADLAFRAYF